MFPKGNPDNTRGKQRPEVQELISKTTRTLNGLHDRDLDVAIEKLRHIVQEVAPGGNAEKWFSRGVEGLNLTPEGANRTKFHTMERAKEILAPQLQEQAQSLDLWAEQMINKHHEIKFHVEAANSKHLQRLTSIYEEVQRLDRQNNGPSVNPQVAQGEWNQYTNSELIRQIEIKQIISPYNPR